MTKPFIEKSPVWKQLTKHALSLKQKHIRDLFEEDTMRGKKMHKTVTGLQYNFSREKIDEKGFDLLFGLAKEAELNYAISAMFRGDKINFTEKRSVLHTALRMPKGKKLIVDGVDVVTQVHKVLDHMEQFTNDVYEGKRLGATGKRIRYVVNIGVGGSDLGARMAYHALAKYRKENLDVRFVSNVDPTDLIQVLEGLTPEETLFIVCSKTFTTKETMTNAQRAKQWIEEADMGNASCKKHFCAVSTNRQAVSDFGIDAENMFEFWDWVGGRFSMSSAVGLSLMMGIGPENFRKMLSGMHDVDVHYATTPFENNVPVIMALLCIWNTHFLGKHIHGIMIYDKYLELLPKHLQQLLCESLGKTMSFSGSHVPFATCPVYLDALGTDFQHAFGQLLHQGTTRNISLTFLASSESLQSGRSQDQSSLLANMFAQADSLAFGVKSENPHKIEPGNITSSILLIDKLTPYSLGQLIALFEHQVHAQASLLGINGFDQFGVEAGKKASIVNEERFKKDGFTPHTVLKLLQHQ